MSEDVEPEEEGTEAEEFVEATAQLTALATEVTALATEVTGLAAQLGTIVTHLAPKEEPEEEEEEEEEEESTKIAMLFAILRAMAFPVMILTGLFFAGALTYEAKELEARFQERIVLSQTQWAATRKSELLETLYHRIDCKLVPNETPARCPLEAGIRARAEAALEYNQLVTEASEAQAPVDYSSIDLRGARLLVADLQRINFHDALLQDTNFGLANLMHANLQGAKMQHADLQGAQLQHANLQDANLTQSNLQDANLQGANLQGTNLKGANLQGIVTVTKRQIHGACIDASTRLPEALFKVKTSTAACTQWLQAANPPPPPARLP